MKIGAVVLAAGLSRRYGANKLLVRIGNKPMVGIAFDTLKAIGGLDVAAVISDPAVAALAREAGVRVIHNAQPELGQGHSIALAANAMREMDALLLMAADQPNLSVESVKKLIDTFREGGCGMACLRDETHAGNPAIFVAQYFGEMEALSGDTGAKWIMKRHPEDVRVVPCLHDGELADADTPRALDELTNI